MLSRNYRLNAADFKFIKSLAEKKSFSSSGLSLAIWKSGYIPSRFAVVISGSLIKKAVLRNKTKRRVKAVIFKHLGDLKDGFAVVVYPKKILSFKEAEEELLNLFKKAKILVKNG
jgi:ribonuclease P protein component